MKGRERESEHADAREWDRNESIMMETRALRRSHFTRGCKMCVTLALTDIIRVNEAIRRPNKEHVYYRAYVAFRTEELVVRSAATTMGTRIQT